MEVAPVQDPGPVPPAAPPQAAAAPVVPTAAPAAPAANENPSSKAGGGEVGAAAGGAGGGGGSAPAPAGKAEEDASVSWNDIKSVQNLIERCLQKFMTQTEIIAALQVCWCVGACDLGSGLGVYRVVVQQ